MYVDSDIEVEIGPSASPGEYTVRVAHAVGGGQPMGTLNLDVAELLGHREQWEGAVLASSVRARRMVPTIELPVRELGLRLFQALFDGPISGTYRASLGAARGRDQGLRLVLRLTAPELAVLPWEAMFDPETETYLCRREPLVRHVPAPFMPDPLEVSRPLRILGLVASPRGLPMLDVEAEQERLTSALAQPLADRRVELDWVLQASWDGVHERLLGEPWHVVHFVGHGDFDPEIDEGVIALVGENGRADLVEASRLADLLSEARPIPRLVVLNSCASGEGGSDLFSGTAAALVHSGIHAVAAMQFSISDEAAIRFARGFYTALAEGRGVDEATRSGRIAILGMAPGTLEWVTPVLYLRGNDTHLFSFAQDPAGARDEVQHWPRAGPSRRTLDEPPPWARAEPTQQADDQLPHRARAEPTQQAHEQLPSRAAPTQAYEQATHPPPVEPDQQSPVEPKRTAVPVAGPIILGISLLLLAWDYASNHYYLGKPWQWIVLYSAAMGTIIAVIENRFHRIRAWTVALEFSFIWFVSFMIYESNFRHIRNALRPLHNWQALAIIAGAGAIVGVSLCILILIRTARKKGPVVHPLVPTFLGFMALGLCVAAIGYIRHHHNDGLFQLAGVFLFAALLADLLAPFLARVRRPQDQRAGGAPDLHLSVAGPRKT
jgi:CHAT domain